MKLLLIPLLLLLGACMSGHAVKSTATSVTAEECDPSGCRVEVECTDRGTCIVTCFDANGDIRCQQEIECDGPCEKVCDKPCEAPSSCPKR